MCSLQRTLILNGLDFSDEAPLMDLHILTPAPKAELLKVRCILSAAGSVTRCYALLRSGDSMLATRSSDRVLPRTAHSE
jgi:hypothetical protein